MTGCQVKASWAHIMPKTEVPQAPAEQAMDSGKGSGLGVREL